MSYVYGACEIPLFDYRRGSMRAEYLECARIINTHGTDGTVKLESWCDSPQVLAEIGTLYFKDEDAFAPCAVLRASVFKSFVLAKLEGISDLETAEALRGRVLYASREDIAVEDGAHFISDLIGLDIIDADSGKLYGKLTNIINGGASDIYVVKCDDGERMMPAVSEYVRKIDLERGIFVSPIEGMF